MAARKVSTVSHSDQLSILIRTQYDALDDEGVIAIAPSDLAQAVYEVIDPTSKSPDLVRLAAILELRQLSRAICRERYVEKENATDQSSLFEYALQPRYPAERGTGSGEVECFYVLRDYLSLEERFAISERLRREARSKLRHADALDAETNQLISIGRLHPSNSIA
jgi:hypothetical protein